MITADYCQTMARYNAWQNKSLVMAADTLTEEARRADRGAFFGSIQGTLSHILWGDIIWMSRFAAWEAPEGGIPESPQLFSDWEVYKLTRQNADDRMLSWAMTLKPADFDGDLSWYSEAAEREITKPRALLLTHLFNHQTHHRGQVHAMLTSAGAKPGPTDIPLMPETI